MQERTSDSLAQRSRSKDFHPLPNLSKHEIFGQSFKTAFPYNRSKERTLPSPVVHQTPQMSAGAHENFVSPDESELKMAWKKKVEEELFIQHEGQPPPNAFHELTAPEHLCCH